MKIDIIYMHTRISEITYHRIKKNILTKFQQSYTMSTNKNNTGILNKYTPSLFLTFQWLKHKPLILYFSQTFMTLPGYQTYHIDIINHCDNNTLGTSRRDGSKYDVNIERYCWQYVTVLYTGCWRQVGSNFGGTFFSQLRFFIDIL